MYKSMLDLVGKTPLVKVTKIDTGKCDLFLKLECQNPGGSIKDRIGLSMIESAEKKGLIKTGDSIIEATAGNTGLGLALVAAQKGYKLILVIPDKMSKEKIYNLEAMGVKVIITRSDVNKGHPEYYQDIAEKIAIKKNIFYVNQFGNPDNPKAHEKTTGPEIWSQMNKKVDAIVCGVGSGGTITGLSNFFGKVSPATELVLADPEGSILVDYIKTGKFGEAGSWIVEGIGEDFIPPIADLKNVRKAYTVTDRESCQTAIDLLKKESILGGSSSGTLVNAAIKYCKEQDKHKRVVTFICDTGNKYLSKIYNKNWLLENNIIKVKKYNDIRDFVSKRSRKNEIIFIKPKNSFLVALNKMQKNKVSELVVLDDSQNPIGIIDESVIFNIIKKNELSLNLEINKFIKRNIKFIESSDNEKLLSEYLNKNNIVFVNHNNKFFGIITKADFISFHKKKIENKND